MFYADWKLIWLIYVRDLALNIERAFMVFSVLVFFGERSDHQMP